MKSKYDAKPKFTIPFYFVPLHRIARKTMFKTDGNYIHPLELEAKVNLPERFTFPFYYEPHPLCVKASEEIQNYLDYQRDFDHNFGLDNYKKGTPIGKMFGVMIVQQNDGSLGYLAGFSGKIAEQNFLKGFVPPIFDTLDPNGFYKQGELELNKINAEIEHLENKTAFINAKDKVTRLIEEHTLAISKFKALVKSKKQERASKRLEAEKDLTSEGYNALDENLKKESIFYHFRLKELKQEWRDRIKTAQTEFQRLNQKIEQLKEDRQQRSASLQRRIHDQYNFLNYKGESKGLRSIFEATDLLQPPAGSGECAAPKLFQYAYQHELKPIAMAEFWWGASPRSEVRRHKSYYPSCRGKCEPILGFMMQGLEVDPNPMELPINTNAKLDIIYEDDYLLLLNKPHEFLSVPGKLHKDSVLTRMQDYLPNSKGPLLVHRLDMSTSGLLLVAKNEKTYKNLQKQFIERTIKKRYVAVLKGELDRSNGTIDLPLRVDLNNRPRQLVCDHYGKQAVTKYEVIKNENGKTRIHFYPVTGRTHQLRVHAAHHKGLDHPILGDDLYGTRSDRLYLHAEELQFEHPVKNEWLSFSCKAPF